jgi:hypothetical protein
MIAFLVLLGALAPLVSGFSNGTGSCAGNGAPVGGNHLTRVDKTSGSLEAYDISITLGASDPFEVGVPFEFESGRPHFLTMSCSSLNPYLGFLLRLASPDGVDTTTALIPFPTDSDTQVAEETCIDIEGVGGLTHTNNAPKSVSQSILQMDEAAEGLILDVTIVVANKGFYSEFYYSQYILNAVAPITPPGGTPSFVPSSMFQPTASQDAASSSFTLTPDEDQVQVITVPTTPDVAITVPTTPGYPFIPTTPEGPPSKGQGASQDTAPAASPDAATVFAPAAAPTATASAAAPTATNAAPAGTTDDSPAAAPSGIQDESAASASRDASGVSSRRGITGFTTFATISLLAFATFCIAF